MEIAIPSDDETRDLREALKELLAMDGPPAGVSAEDHLVQVQVAKMLVGKACILHKVKLARGVRGTVDCPACSGQLHYSVAASNGHVHARCDGTCGTHFLE